MFRLSKMKFYDDSSLFGFTLLELMVYLGLFAVLAGNAVAIVYRLSETQERLDAQAQMQESLEFAKTKLAWYSVHSNKIFVDNENGYRLSVQDETDIRILDLHSLLPSVYTLEALDSQPVFFIKDQNLSVNFNISIKNLKQVVSWNFALPSN